MRVLSLLLVLVLAFTAGCTEQPLTTSITGEEGDQIPLAKKGAIHSVQVLAFDADGWEFYLECLAEDVTYFGTLDFELTTVETPSGNSKTTWRGLYSYPYGFTSSGDHVWYMTHGTQTAQEQVKADGRYQQHFSLHEWYENEIGERLLQVGTYGARLDPGGNVVFERFHGWCPGQPDTEFSNF